MKSSIKVQILFLLLSIFVPSLFRIQVPLAGIYITFGRLTIVIIFLLCLYREHGHLLFRHKLEVTISSFFCLWLLWGIALAVLKGGVHKEAIKELANIFLGGVVIYCILRLIKNSKEAFDYTWDLIEKLIIVCIMIGLLEIISGKHLQTSCFNDLKYINIQMRMYGTVYLHQATGFQYGTNDFSAFLTFFFPLFLRSKRVNLFRYLAIGAILIICMVNSSTLCVLTIILGTGIYLAKDKEGKKVRVLFFTGAIFIGLICLGARNESVFSLVDEIKNHLHNFQLGGGSSYKRFWTYAESLAIGAEAFFIGIGPANFTNYVVSNPMEHVLLNPHNLWLEIFTEYGLLIILFYVFFLFRLFIRAKRIYAQKDIREAIVIQIMLINYVVIGIVPSTFVSYWYQWLLIALGIAVIQIYEIKGRKRINETII